MLIGVHDPHGVRPLVLGKQGGTFVLASETCALDIVGASFERDLEPGEMLMIKMASFHASPFNRRDTVFVFLNIFILPGLTAF